MINPLQPAPSSTQLSSLRRLLAFFSLILMLAASSVQASHVHGDWLPHPDAQAAAATDAAQSPGGEAGCPLCVAMHSAAASSVLAQETGGRVVGSSVPGTIPAWRAVAWHFALFSRPPPLQLS